MQKIIIAKFKKKLMFLDVVENSQNQLGKPDSRITLYVSLTPRLI